jgi:hypothetical protein
MNLDRDELINFAFDELDDSQAQVLAARLLQDKSAGQEINELKLLKGDLKELRNSVPELQFSAERLKLAIEAAGKPKAPWYSKLWPGIMVPVAGVACFVLAATVLNTRPSSEPKVVLNMPQTKPIEDLNVAFNTPDINAPEAVVGNLNKPAPPTIMTDTDSATTVREDRSVARVNVKKVRPAGKRTRNSDVVASLRTNNRSRVAESTRVTEPRDRASLQPTVADTAETTVASLSASKPEETTIVIIQPGVDAGNGSSTATEVTNPTHVVIGG